MPEQPRPATVKVELGPARFFTTWTVLAVNACGLLLAVPVLLAVLALSLVKFSFYSVLLPFAAIALTAWYLPFGLGNPYIRRLVRSFSPNAAAGHNGYIVQVTADPRIQSGLRALLEDADDIGFLSFTDDEVVFEGDSLRLSVPFDQIDKIQVQNIGMRGLFVYRRIRVAISGTPGFQAFEFAERGSYLLPTARKTTRRLREQLMATARESNTAGQG